MGPAAEQRNRSNEMPIEARSQAAEISGQRLPPPIQGSSVRSAMFIATTTPEALPSSVGAAWMGGVALQQGLGESGGASAYKHAAPTGLGDSCGALGYKHVAPTGLGGLGGAIGCQHPERMCAKSSDRSTMLVATTTRGLNPKAEARIALGSGFRSSDFGTRPSFGPRVPAFGFQRIGQNVQRSL